MTMLAKRACWIAVSPPEGTPVHFEIHIGQALLGSESSENMARASKHAGEKLADEIQRELMSSSMGPGTIVASEGDLRATHDVGRSVLRQAVRILESRGVVKMRRGQRGGLIVQQPGPEAAARSLAILIESELVTPSDLQMLVKVSDNQIFTRDLARVSIADFRDLRALATHLDSISSEEFAKASGHRTLLDAVRRVIPNPALALAQWTCLECGIDLTPARPHALGERLRSEFWALSVQSLEAMIAHDIARLFEIRLRQYRIMDESARDWPVDAPANDPALLPRRDYQNITSPKPRADILTREILRDARALGWREGARLGTANELVERYGVSLLVLRQAVRVLEECAAIRMERGRYGGLFIAKPSREAALLRARAHLGDKLSAEDARAFLLELLLACLSMARSRASPAAMERCRGAIAGSHAPFLRDEEQTRELCGAIAGLADNPSLTIFIEVIGGLALKRDGPGDRPRPMDGWPFLQEMYQALLERDNALARRALLQHFADGALVD
jgi:DNA-binding FadR family transcriptional regulator